MQEQEMALEVISTQGTAIESVESSTAGSENAVLVPRARSQKANGSAKAKALDKTEAVTLPQQTSRKTRTLLPDGFMSGEESSVEKRNSDFARFVTPRPGTVVTFLFLEMLQKRVLHSLWIEGGNGYEFYDCGEGCQLCSVGEEKNAKEYYVSRIYRIGEDDTATLILPIADTSRTKVKEAGANLRRTYRSHGDEVWRIPFELKMEEKDRERTVILEPEKRGDDSIVVLNEKDPITLASYAVWETLPEQMPFRQFSVDADGQLFPGKLQKWNRKFGQASK